MTELFQKAADASARPSDALAPSDPPLLPAPVAPRESSALTRWRGPMREWPLSPQQQRFVQEYLIDLNASAAARRAGYSERTAREQSVQLMAKLKITRAITEAMDARSKRLDISADRVLLELARIAFSDIGRIVNWSEEAFTVQPPARLSADDRAAISEIAVITANPKRGHGLAVRVKMHDKQRALMLLARHLRLWGPHAIRNVESPAVAAERIRALIRAKFAKLHPEQDEGDA